MEGERLKNTHVDETLKRDSGKRKLENGDERPLEILLSADEYKDICYEINEEADHDLSDHDVRALITPQDLPSAFWEQANRFQIIYSLAGLILGLVCIIGGIILFLRGITGSTSWTAKILGAESKVSDAAPGAVLFIVGLFTVFVTRYKVKIGRK